MQQSQWVKKILKTIPKKRKFKKSEKQKRRAKVSSIIQKKHFTKKNIIKMLNHYEIFTLHKLRQWNVRNPNRIPYQVIKQLFGSWVQCKKYLNYDFSSRFKFDQQKVISAAAHFKILTRRQYNKAHQLQPKLFPMYSWVLKHFQNFSNFKRLVKANIVQDILTRFFQLKMKLKRYPTKLQCNQNNIEIDVLYQFWSPQELKQMVIYLEKQYEKQQRLLDKQSKKIDNIEIE